MRKPHARAVKHSVTAQDWARRGVLAILASALDCDVEASGINENERHADVAIVTIEGPLTHEIGRGWWCWFDSYAAIVERVGAAIESGVKSIVLRINSPGGDALGCFEASREISRMCADADVKLVAFADELAASAAFALACSAGEIYAPPSAVVGSIGVINCLVDCTEMDNRDGLRFELITSGARKADGNPHQPMTKAVVAKMQHQVDELAAQFFSLVAESRGMKPAQIKAFEANTFLADEALDIGLIDGVGTLDEVLEMLVGDAADSTHADRQTEKTEGVTMRTKVQIGAMGAKKSEGSDAKKKAEKESKKSKKADDEDAEEDAEDEEAEEEEAEEEEAEEESKKSKKADDESEEESESEDDEDEKDEDEKKDEDAKLGRKIRKLVGATSSAAALGVVLAWQSSHAALPGLRDRNQKSAKSIVIERATKEGKITPAQAKMLVKQSLATVRAFCAAAVPMFRERSEARGPDGSPLTIQIGPVNTQSNDIASKLMLDQLGPDGQKLFADKMAKIAKESR